MPPRAGLTITLKITLDPRKWRPVAKNVTWRCASDFAGMFMQEAGNGEQFGTGMERDGLSNCIDPGKPSEPLHMHAGSVVCPQSPAIWLQEGYALRGVVAVCHVARTKTPPFGSSMCDAKHRSLTILAEG